MNFWKLKHAIAEHQLVMASLRAADSEANAALKAAFVEAGLDPSKHYRVDNVKETFTEATEDTAPHGS